jgi:HD-GYP domain-containing protein (c-di-GMP phosphodiesterase class II)
MISSVKRLNNLMPAVKYHHEHYDGTGFFGLRGEKIPLMARIVAVADAFDAMTSTRPYLNRRGYVSAMKELQDKSGSHYDPKVVEAFFKSHISRLAIRH